MGDAQLSGVILEAMDEERQKAQGIGTARNRHDQTLFG
jgi:hypothetical protein